MGGVVSVLVVLAYLVFLIDWRELRGVLAQGGWGTAVIYGVVTVLVAGAISCPAMLSTPAVHH